MSDQGKKTRWVLVATVIILVAAGLFSWLRSRTAAPVVAGAQAQEVLEIGALLPLTGAGAVFADYIKKGLDLAEEELEADGEDAIEIVYRDSKNDPTTGVSAFQQMILTSDPPVVVSALSSVTKAVAPLAARNDTVVVGTAVSLPDITEESEYVFRVYPEAEGVAGVIDDYAAEQCSTAAVAYINDDFGISGANVFEQQLEAAGDQVLLKEPYNLLETDFRGQWEKVKSADPDCVWIIGYGPAYSVLVRQFREVGVEATLLGDMTLGLPITLKNAGEAAEGVVFVDALIDPDFVARYRERYGEPPTSYAGYAYDIIMMLDRVRKEYGATADGIRRGFAAIRDFQGVMGPISITETGDSELRFELMRVDGGVVAPLD